LPTMQSEPQQSNPVELLLWLLRRRRRFRITGESMLPALHPGDEVLIARGAAPRPGDIVVVQHPYQTGLRMVKRVASVRDDGSVALEGDTPGASTDSRAFGAVPAGHVLGRVTSRLP
jgi:nickel-type superoxide dismutase maturation protease